MHGRSTTPSAFLPFAPLSIPASTSSGAGRSTSTRLRSPRRLIASLPRLLTSGGSPSSHLLTALSRSRHFRRSGTGYGTRNRFSPLGAVSLHSRVSRIIGGLQ